MFDEKKQDMSPIKGSDVNSSSKGKTQGECLSLHELKTKATMSKTNEVNNDNKTELLIDQEEMPEIKEQQGNKQELDPETVKVIKYLNKEALRHKIKANFYFKGKKYDLALAEYKKTIDLLSLHEKLVELGSITNVNYILNECLINSSVCYLLLKQYTKVLEITKQILSSNLSVNRLKCHLIRSKAFQGLSMYGEAVESLKQALSIKPTEALLRELEKIESKIKLYPESASKKTHSDILPYMSKNFFFKFLRIFFSSLTNFLKNNKFICFVIGLLVFLELKNGISSMFTNMVHITKFYY